MPDTKYPKKEHLCGDKAIEHLYQNGKSFLIYPIRVVYITVENEKIAVRAMMSVSKKKIKHAVARNRIKRLLRETYRLHKQTLFNTAEKKGLKLHIAFQYVANETLPYHTISEKMEKVIKKTIQTISPDEIIENTY